MAHGNKIDGGCLQGLRAADAGREPAPLVPAGPFEAPQAGTAGGMTLSDALITGLLVAYPALATAVALVVGMSLSGRVI